jgi:epoxyqueuosine reductase QueG
MGTLNDEVVAWLKANGANVVGISSVDRFDGAPKGHRPSDFIQGARSVVTFGVAMLYNVLNWEDKLVDSELVAPEHRKDLLQNYGYNQMGLVMLSDLIDRMAIGMANLLEGRGYPSLFFPATYGIAFRQFIRERIPSRFGLFSQRHAAVMAGLGEFGLNNLVVTPQYGSRIRFNSVITEAELTPSPLLKEKACQGESCSKCQQNCPGALSIRQDIDTDAVCYITPARTNMNACLKFGREQYCIGRCIKVCPVAQKNIKQ